MRANTRATGWSVLRGAMALLIAAAIAAQLAASVRSASELGRDVGTVVMNFFSFFTVLSNTLTVAVLLWAVIWFFLRGRRTGVEPPLLALALAAVTTYMTVTGLVYNTLLRNVELPQGSEAIPWSNEVLHLVGPVFLFVDLLVGPRRRRLSWTALWTITAVPLLWVAYTIVRGPLVINPVTGAHHWYPYPFLDPNGPGGWPSVIAYAIGIAVAIVLVAVIVVWRRRREPPEAGTAAGAGSSR